jgi:probable HAF family extracellular repeat protein
MNRHVSFLAMLIICLVCNVSQAITYTVTDLGGGTARAINNLGQIVGDAGEYGSSVATVYNGSTMIALEGAFVSGENSSATGINASGQIVGWHGLSVGNRAFLYSGSSFTDLGTLGGMSSVAYAINDSTQIVGRSYKADGSTHAFLYSSGTMTDIGALGGIQNGYPGGTLSQANGINNSGQVIGGSLVDKPGYSGGIMHAFLYSGGSMIDLGTLSTDMYSSSYATGINNNVQVIGYSEITNASGQHSFLYSEGSMIDLGTLGGFNSYANGINDSCQIVGYSDMGGDLNPSHAFLDSDGTMYDLNTLLDSSGIGWTLTMACGINDLGQIVGGGTNPQGRGHAFLLTPVPEPSMLVRLGTAILGLVWILFIRQR